MQKIKKVLVVSIIAAVFIVIWVMSYDSKKMLVFRDSLDKVVVTVDGKDLTIKEIAFYVAYEETTIEEQAYVYDPEDTGAYWKLHIDGQFIRVAGKQAALDMAIHDEIFYELAQKEGLTLSEEEQVALNNKESDFWSDLTDEQKEKLGVTEDQIKETITHLALAEKYQNFLAEQSVDDSYDSYSISGENYQKILDEHSVKVRDKVWDKIDFGSVVVNH
ncbi:MAG: SurA N-terminal domain-containing protein [Lachnospiraceae bacterium]|uniref:SurA N-terminal domain-containing protein n=1 Tax=Roseburia hominis TaxID=301301 RepID=UPI001F382126|nr:hypothetical protein [Roseburia hominis]MCI5713182.1 SurA N-terminal domain-containing protein [Lachnospiraceae bacterium]MDD6169383.1 SurA N-terminal domain-containing protein [Lachnospiraceae bacterium]MDY4839475.1 SurA N-terminal domain-containing protein [Lachnospiraceae bacterium]